MDIWIIRDGEKTGPFHDFEIRRKIGTRELEGSTPAWHEGMVEWKPLEEISLFHGEFSEDPEVVEVPVSPPPLPAPPVYVRRFFARWLDVQVYCGLWWLGLWFLGKPVENVLGSSLVIVVMLIPWFALETYLHHRIGTTPGKWLLGLRVENIDGTKLSLMAATHRSLRVFLVGIGMGVAPFSWFCQAISFFVAKRFGSALWDLTAGHKVTSQALVPAKIVCVVFLYIAAFTMQWMVLGPYIMEGAIKQNPEKQAELEALPKWYLPKR